MSVVELKADNVEVSQELSVFDRCNGDPDRLFVDPTRCSGIQHVFWADMEYRVEEMDESNVFDFLTSNGIQAPDDAIMYLTEEQYDAIMETLLKIQSELDITAIEVAVYYLNDCLYRARQSNTIF